MDTTVGWYCLKKWCGFGVGIASLLLLLSCPGEDMDCNDIGSIAETPDLISLSPEQATYNVGDELTLSLVIPAINDYYGSEKNLYTLTGDESARLILAFEDLFTGNSVTTITGSQSDYPNWFDMPYDPSSGTYQLEVKVTLNVAGLYSSSSMGTVTIQGSDYCDRFFVDSYIPWNLTDGLIEFTVNE